MVGTGKKECAVELGRTHYLFKMIEKNYGRKGKATPLQTKV